MFTTYPVRKKRGPRPPTIILLIGWDAADSKVIHSLLGAGMLPNLVRLMHAAVMGDLATLFPAFSPICEPPLPRVSGPLSIVDWALPSRIPMAPTSVPSRTLPARPEPFGIFFARTAGTAMSSAGGRRTRWSHWILQRFVSTAATIFPTAACNFIRRTWNSRMERVSYAIDTLHGHMLKGGEINL